MLPNTDYLFHSTWWIGTGTLHSQLERRSRHHTSKPSSIVLSLNNTCFVLLKHVGRVCFIALLPLVTMAITWISDYYAVLFFVSMTGAYTFIVGIDFLAHTGYISGVKQILDHNDISQYSIDARVYVMLVITAVICILSFIWQYIFTKQKSTIHASTKDEETPPAADSPPPEQQEPNTATVEATHGSSVASASAAFSPRSMSISQQPA